MIEVGVIFALAAAVWILLGPERRTKWWVFAIPLALFAAWFAWAAQYPRGDGELGNLTLVIPTWFEALGASLVALSGRFPTGDGASVTEVGGQAWAMILAGVALVALVLRVWRGGPLPRTFWPFVAAALGYWTLLGLADREPDGARYLYVGAVLVLLIAADAARGWRPGRLGSESSPCCSRSAADERGELFATATIWPRRRS